MTMHSIIIVLMSHHCRPRLASSWWKGSCCSGGTAVSMRTHPVRTPPTRSTPLALCLRPHSVPMQGTPPFAPAAVPSSPHSRLPGLLSDDVLCPPPHALLPCRGHATARGAGLRQMALILVVPLPWSPCSWVALPPRCHRPVTALPLPCHLPVTALSTALPPPCHRPATSLPWPHPCFAGPWWHST